MSKIQTEQEKKHTILCPKCRTKLLVGNAGVFRCPKCQNAFLARKKMRYVRKKESEAHLRKEVVLQSKNDKKHKWKEMLLSPTLAGKSVGKRVAYIAVVTALVVVCNMFFEFKLAETQFSLTIVVSSLAGIVIGPLFGFAACFLGDLVGFLYHSAGFAYLPWIGVSMGMTALLSGVIVGGIQGKKSWFLYVKLALVSVLTFVLCTVAINTTAFWLLYSKVDFWTYFVSRIFVQGQIWNTLLNAALLFIVVPTLKSVKALKIYVH